MMRWWFEKGIDGFRMDVINLISKADGLPDGDPEGEPVVLNVSGESRRFDPATEVEYEESELLSANYLDAGDPVGRLRPYEACVYRLT